MRKWVKFHQYINEASISAAFLFIPQAFVIGEPVFQEVHSAERK
jgi:hypothetical protein